MGNARFSFTALACFSSFLLHCQCALSDPASPARLTLDVAVDRVGMAWLPVTSVDICVLLWHELSCGAGPEQCSPAEALSAALSVVAQLRRHRCCFCSREVCCAWLLADTSDLRSSPHSVCVVTRALSTGASHLSTCCVWMGRCCFGVRVLALPSEALVPQPCVHHSRGEALFPRVLGPTSARRSLDRAPWPLLAGGVPWLAKSIYSRLSSHRDVLRLMPILAACADPVPRGQRAPPNSALC